MAEFTLAGGRALPRLLFVTTEEALAVVGLNEKRLRDLLGDRHRVIVLVAPTDAESAMRAVRSRLESDAASPAAIGGVVLVGGYDVLPSRVLKTVSTELVALCVDPLQDLDRYHVWNDDLYGDLDGDELPEVPVSRIPCSRDWSSASLLRALQASNPDPNGGSRRAVRRGVRLAGFPIADRVYAALGNESEHEAMLVWEPPLATLTKEELAADRLYLVLHGKPYALDSFTDWEGRVVVSADAVPEADGMVVLAACCWGALTVNKAPNHVAALPDPLETKPIEASIAVKFVASGAMAFVGFTAAHFVPRTLDGDQRFDDYYGSPLHDRFWRNHVGRGMPPAQALFQAKANYICDAPHRNARVQLGIKTAAAALATEMKVYWSATCLGLGW